MTETSVPHLFRCPISLDVFADPVTLCTGQTYDRRCIERWLAAGHRTCPVTMQPLHDTTLLPNNTLRHLVEQWLADHAAADRHSVLSLSRWKQCLQSDAATASAKIEVLNNVVALLSTESDAGRSRLDELDFFTVVLQLALEEGNGDHQMAELALECASSLTPSMEASAIFKKRSTLSSLERMLEQGSDNVKSSLFRLLESPQLAAVAGKSSRVMRQLVLAVRDGKARDAAVRALAAVCAVEDNRSNAIKAGAVGILVKNLAAAAASRSRRNARAALAALEDLVRQQEGKKAMAKIGNAVHVVVRHVFVVSSGDNEGGEHAVGALIEVCTASARARAEAVSAGVVTQLLLLLQSQCGATAKGKARLLLKLLKST